MVGRSKVVVGDGEERTVIANVKGAEPTERGAWKMEGAPGKRCRDSPVSSLGAGWKGLLFPEVGATRGLS